MKRLTASLLLFASVVASAGEYAGSAACRNCHVAEYENWLTSDHQVAMLPPTDSSVLGPFDGSTVRFHGIDTRFYRTDDAYWLETSTGEGRETFPVTYTFGAYPLQQYLVDVGGGHLQAFNVAWDSRIESEGGQRWFHLRDEVTQESPFFWTRHLQNWNGGCADCHSTNLQLNYDSKTGEFQTTFAEPNVGCEACHGPAAEHIATGGKASLLMLENQIEWKFTGGAPVAEPQGAPSRDYIDMCGGCHSRRSVVGEIAPGNSFRDQFQVSLLADGLYFADGQIDDEVFVLGSYMQSKMHQAGVTCMDCHEPHSGEVRFDDNRLCAGCHNPVEFDQPEHAGHSSDQAMCVDCHMPERTYMVVDDRRDHRFGIPDPRLTHESAIPNACQNCHADQSTEWAIENTPDRQDLYAELTIEARRFNPEIIPRAAAYVQSPGHPSIKRASLLATLPLTRESYSLATGLLGDADPMLRAAASELIAGAPPGAVYESLARVINDPDKAVRMAAARALAPLVPQLPIKDAGTIVSAVNELKRVLPEHSAAGLTAAGQLELQMGKRKSGLTLMRQALEKEPHYIPALVNLAESTRRDDEAGARKMLRRAVSVAPDSGAANHSYGLALVRDGKAEASIEFLKAATEQADSIPRYAYVYAVALDSVGRTAKALDVISASLKKWPNQSNMINLQSAYRRKSAGKTSDN